MLTEFFPATDAGEITGGIEPVSFYLTHYLERQGHIVKVVALKTDGTVWEWTSLSSVPGRIAFLIRALATGLWTSADVIEGTNQAVHGLAWVIGRLRKRPVVFHYHDVLLGRWAEMGDAGWLGEAVERLNLSLRADRYIVPSRVVEQRLVLRGIPARLIRIVPNGYDDDLVGAVRQEEHPKTVTVTVVGRLLRYKGTHVVVEAVRRLIHEGRELTVRVVGRGPELEALKRQAREGGIADRVEFVGFIRSHADVLRAMSQSRLVVSASTIEGFGLVLLEAMALGVPYVASNIEAFAEVTDGGKGGFLVDSQRVDEFTSSIRRLLDDDNLYADCVADALSVARPYGWQASAIMLEKLLEELVNK